MNAIIYRHGDKEYTPNATEAAALESIANTLAAALAIATDNVDRANTSTKAVKTATEAVRAATDSVETAKAAVEAAKAKTYEAWTAVRNAEAAHKAATKADKPAAMEALKSANAALEAMEADEATKREALTNAENALAEAWKSHVAASSLVDAYLANANKARADYNKAALAEVIEAAKVVNRHEREEDSARREVMRGYWFNRRASAKGIEVKSTENGYAVSASPLYLDFSAFDRVFSVATTANWKSYLKIAVNNMHRYAVHEAEARNAAHLAENPGAVVEAVPTVDKPLPVKLVNLRNSDPVFTGYESRRALKAQLLKVAFMVFEKDAPTSIGGAMLNDLFKAFDKYVNPAPGADMVLFETVSEKQLTARFINVLLAYTAGNSTYYREAAMYSKSDLEAVDAQ